MGHIKYRKTTRAESTPSEWLAVGAQIGQLTNIWSMRGDIVGYVGPGAGGIAPACFTPATAEVEVNVDIAFGKGTTPADIGDIRERDTQFLWPKATGAIFHEALHARFSNWDIEQAARELSAQELRALLLLEEGRIEAQGLAILPENAGFLRACALEIVLADIDDEPLAGSDTQAAAHLAALTMARVDAGSIEQSDIEGLTASITDKLGESTLEKLRTLWLAAQEHVKHHDITDLYDVARQWVAAVNERAEENGEQSSDGEQGEGDSGSASGSEFIKDVLAELSEAADNATIASFEQLADQQESEEWSKIAQSKATDARTQKEHENAAAEVFGRGTGPLPENPTYSRLMEERAPTGPERAAAVKIAQLLDKAKYRERDETEVNSVLPPGRLRTRAMVQGAALKSKGVMTQVEPWRRTKRKHVDDPTLTIGVMVDISGSMAEAMEPMAVTAWVMSEAVRRVQGRAAMMYFGTGIFPTLKPGQHLDKVKVYSAPDGTEKFDSAFKALNGGLSLLHGTGARLLVIVSDGCYTDVERKAARRWIAECAQQGVGVLWLPFCDQRHATYVDGLVSGTPTVVLHGTESPVNVASDIGMAAARALTAIA